MLAALAVVAAACGDDETAAASRRRRSSRRRPTTSIGEGEGELNLIAWHGYAEDGTTEGGEDYDWVTPFEDETGCKVNVKYGDTSDEMVHADAPGRRHRVRRRVGIGRRDQPADRRPATWRRSTPSLFPDFENVIAPLNPDGGTNNAHYIVDGNVYGVAVHVRAELPDVQHGRGQARARRAGTSCSRPDSPYAGKVTAYDCPIYIADAAMYLMTHKPDLGITDPYELTQDQFDAAVELLKTAGRMIGKYWALLHGRDRRFIERLDGGRDGVADQPQPTPSSTRRSTPVIPSEGIDRLGRHLDDLGERPAPQLHAEVDGLDDAARGAGRGRRLVRRRRQQHDVLRRDQGLLVEFYGKGADAAVDTVRYGFCGDVEFLNSLYLWKTPLADCGDDRGDVCMDYSEWTQAWTEIRGA